MQNDQSTIRHLLVRGALLLGAFSLCVNVLMLTMPLYLMQIYERVLPSRSLDTLTYLTLLAVLALLVMGLLDAVRAILASRVGTRLDIKLSDAILSARFADNAASDGTKRGEALEAAARLRGFFASRAIFALLDLPFTLLFVGLLYLLHPALFWLTLGGAAMLVMIAFASHKLVSRRTVTAQGAALEARRRSLSLDNASETLRAMGLQDQASRFWGETHAHELTAKGGAEDRSALLSGLSRSVRMVLQIGVLGVGAYLVLQGQMTAGMIFAASIISAKALQPIDQMTGSWNHLIVAADAWKSLKTASEAAREAPQRLSLGRVQGAISARNLWIEPSRPGAAPVLRDISFGVAPGDGVAIVGPSGSGKSTLVRLLVGALAPQRGTVRIDGTEREHWDPQSLGRDFGYLEQDVQLLPTTVKRNIARLQDDADDAAVLKAARKAGVHDLISSLPDGYETLIGPGGTHLSGGQRQRIGLARAFFGDPRILILDEPNANLDRDGEAALQTALETARKAGMTFIIVTQRTGVMANVDKVLRLREGTVDFFGTRHHFVNALEKAGRKKVAHG